MKTWVLVGWLLSAAPAHAQVLYGSVVGNVADPTHAAVPGATVRLLNALTSVEQRGETGVQGTYEFRNVQSGTYEVEIIAKGFQTARRTRIEVPSNEVVRVDVQLVLGESNQTITVGAEAAALQTDNSDLHKDLGSKELTDLPVDGYRNYQSLLGLVPGITPPSDSNSIAGNPAGSFVANVNGTSQSNNNTRVDGASNTYLWLPHLTAYVPPIESIGSVNIVTNNYDAEQGFASGAVVSVETKSGSNQIHGSAFEYNTNSATRARNFFDVTPGIPKNIINQYGGTVSGPIKRNKLFYFASFEGTRRRRSYERRATLPLATTRTGNFAGLTTIYDPLTGNAAGSGRTAFPGNIVPDSRILPVAKQIMALVPVPNLAGNSNNYFVSAPQPLNRNNYDGKLNWNPTTRATIFGRYARFVYDTDDLHVLGPAGGQGVATIFPGHDEGAVHSVTVGGTYVFTPTLLLDGHFGFTQQGQNGHDAFYGHNIGLDDFHIPGTNGPTIRESGMPGFQISGYENIGGSIPSSPRFRTDRQYQYAANASLTHGIHSLRWGMEAYRQEMNHYQPAGTYGPRGQFVFGTGITQNAPTSGNQYNSLAAFLLGLPSAGGKSIPTSDEMRTRQWNFGFYFRDRMQLTRRITLNLGVRYEYYPMVTRDIGGVGRYDWTTNQVLIGGFGNVPVDTGVQVPAHQFAPRAGIAWRLGNKTVFRTGYGMSIDPFPLAIPLRSSYPTVIEQTIVAPNTYTPAGSLLTGIPLLTLPDISSGHVLLPNSVTTQTIEQNFHRGYVESFNATLQHSLGGGFSAEAGYAGSRSIRLTNQVDINASSPGLGSAGRPYAGAFGRLVATTLHDPAFTSNYNALQMRLDRRFASGFSVNVAYTYGKALGYGSNNDSSISFNTPSQIRRNRTVQGFDRTNNLRVSFLAELPFGRGKQLLSHGWASRIAGGWQVNGIFSAYSGTPFSVAASATSLNAPGNSQTADQVKELIDYPRQIGPNSSWFDPLAFRAVNAVRFGNTGLNILRGPGYAGVNGNVFRTFRLREKLSLQFRAEAFNVTNTPHFNNPGNSASSMTLNADGSVRSLGGFTVISSAADDARQLRFAMRMFF